MAGTGKDNNTLRGKRLDLRDRSPEGRGAMQLLDVEKTDLQGTRERRKEEQLSYQQKCQRKPPNPGLLGLRGPLGAMWAYSGPMR